jgi:hypothetical protein
MDMSFNGLNGSLSQGGVPQHVHVVLTFGEWRICSGGNQVLQWLVL